jgi:hypothetical protein
VSRKHHLTKRTQLMGGRCVESSSRNTVHDFPPSRVRVTTAPKKTPQQLDYILQLTRRGGAAVPLRLQRIVSRDAHGANDNALSAISQPERVRT